MVGFCSTKLKLTTAAFGLLVCLALSAVSVQADSVPVRGSTEGGLCSTDGAINSASAVRSALLAATSRFTNPNDFGLGTLSNSSASGSDLKEQVTFALNSIREDPVILTGTRDLAVVTHAPEPMSMALLGTGLAGVAMLLRKRKAKQTT